MFLKRKEEEEGGRKNWRRKKEEVKQEAGGGKGEGRGGLGSIHSLPPVGTTLTVCTACP